jgi:thiol-disulfide isomerase/thioredoxin
MDGEAIRLGRREQRRAPVLFWNPDCGFCQQMLPELRQWEASPPAGAPRLLVVSTGTAEANRAQGLKWVG